MSRAVAMTCPNCGANLSAPEDATGATCSYCGQSCVIRGRTRFLQIQRPLPPVPTGVPVVIHPMRTGRLAWVMVAGVVAPLGIGITTTVSALRHNIPTISATSGRSPAVHTPAVTKRSASWNGLGPPLLRDVNGDGVDDAIGLVRYVHDGDQLHMAAFDGGTGARLWESPSLGSYSAVYQGTTYLAGNLVLRSNSGGVLRAFDVATGAPAWTSPMGEQIASLCAGATGGEINVWTRDEVGRRLTLATGALGGTVPKPKQKPTARPRGCPDSASRLANDDQASPSPDEFIGWLRRYHLPGIDLRLVVRHGDVTLVRGVKATGTSVPMVARLTPDRKVAWQAQIPALHPLTSRSQEALTAMTDDLVFALYEASELTTPHMTALALADGARRWDVEIGEPTAPITGIAANQRAVFVSRWGTLRAFDLETGKTLFTIGQ